MREDFESGTNAHLDSDVEVSDTSPFINANASDGDWEICSDCDSFENARRRSCVNNEGIPPHFQSAFDKYASQKMYVGAFPCSCFVWVFIAFLILLALIF